VLGQVSLETDPLLLLKLSQQKEVKTKLETLEKLQGKGGKSKAEI
jgi:hypothetical protein